MSTELTYKVHPIAEVWPRATKDERAALKNSIKSQGVQHPVTMWLAPDKQNFLIDGRTRMEIIEELKREGVTQADNGAPLEVSIATFDGTERQALEYVEATHARRNLTTGQAAAVAVRSGQLARSYKARESGENLPAEESYDELAKLVAAKAGTNHQYVYDCAKLYKTYPDLLDRVASGEINIPQAKRVAHRRDSGLPDEEAPVPEGGTPPVPEPMEKGSTPKTVYDGLKNEVHPDHAETFKARDQLRAINKQIGTLAAAIQEVADGPGGRKMSFNTLKGDLNSIKRHLNDHQPHAICPYCAGTGADTNKEDGRCASCAGHKYLDKIQWKEVPAELKAMFEQNHTPESGGDEAKSEPSEKSDAKATPAPAPTPEPVPAPAGDDPDF